MAAKKKTATRPGAAKAKGKRAPKLAPNAVKRGLTNVVRGTLADARFHPRTLGAVGLFDVIEHIEDDVAFLRAIRPLLMDGAPVYLTVPAGPSLAVPVFRRGLGALRRMALPPRAVSG